MKGGRGSGDISMEADNLIKYQESVDRSWGDPRKLELVTLALMTGYQVALWKSLGKGMASMGQMLQSEVGELIIEILERLGVKADYEAEDIADIIERAFRELGVAKEIRVERLEDVTKYGRRMVRYRVEIKDSKFMPVHKVLAERGLKEYPLSPEALLAAALVRRMLRSKPGGEKARVVAKTLLPQSENEPLTVIIEEVLPLQGQG